MDKATILVVEDEGIVAQDLEDTLRRMGYAIAAVVSSGEEAVQRAEETKPDLVLMDIVLKGTLDGVEAADQIRARLNIPIGFPKRGRKEIAVEAGNSIELRELQRKLYQEAKQELRMPLEEDDRKAVFGKTDRTV